jgi:hypothetical protein
MAQPKCRRRALSPGRRMLCDYIHLSRGDRTAGAERLMQLSDVVAARREASPRPSWGAIMTKAFALAARRHPRLRQAYFSFPWGHLCEYEFHIAGVVMDRRVGDEDMIFLAPLRRPEDQSLPALDGRLRRYKEEPVAELRAFRQVLTVARLPHIIRRFLLWLAFDVLPRRRARHFGTFGVTTMSPFGAKTLQVPSLWTALLHYGVLTEAGEMPVGLAFDHRVLDGATVGFTLLEMEQALHHEIVAELRTMRACKENADDQARSAAFAGEDAVDEAAYVDRR